MRWPRIAVAIFSLSVLGACQGQATARAQWKVYVGTDAPIPQLGQQLLIELLDSSGNDVAPEDTKLVNGSRPELWPVSFGIIPPPSGSTVRIRVRLYRLDETASDGSPQGSTLLDATATLPPVAGGVDAVAMTLDMKCFGVAADPAGHRTCNPSTGQLAAEPTLTSGADPSSLPTAGSWPPAAVVSCSSAAPAGMQCIPGGVFLLGAAHYFQNGIPPAPERLVQLDPFFIDIDETTVGEVRALVQGYGLSAPSTSDPACTYTSTPGASDGLPVNCVTQQQAASACSKLNKRLPSEAEWEYVAGNAGLRTIYPWGNAIDVCSFAVVGRGRALATDVESIECMNAQNGYSPGPVAGGSTLDKTLLGVLNLGGNMSEWVEDLFDQYTGPCWQTGMTPLLDPICSASKANFGHSLRGGSWASAPFAAETYQRNSSNNADIAIGFRCAMGK